MMGEGAAVRVKALLSLGSASVCSALSPCPPCRFESGREEQLQAVSGPQHKIGYWSELDIHETHKLAIGGRAGRVSG